jgi:hypothetical protein
MSYQIVFMQWLDGQPGRFPSEPVRKAFARFGVTRFGSPVHVSLSDGLSVDLSTSSLLGHEATDFMIEFRGLSKELFQLIYDLGCSVPLVALVIEETTLPLIFDETSRKELPHEMVSDREPIFCQSADDVSRAIASGFEKWANWSGVHT